MKKLLGKELEFISWINRDGSGVTIPTSDMIEHVQEEKFKLIRLSMTENTYIASNFNVFVVRIKK